MADKNKKGRQLSAETAIKLNTTATNSTAASTLASNNTSNSTELHSPSTSLISRLRGKSSGKDRLSLTDEKSMKRAVVSTGVLPEAKQSKEDGPIGIHSSTSVSTPASGSNSSIGSASSKKASHKGSAKSIPSPLSINTNVRTSSSSQLGSAALPPVSALLQPQSHAGPISALSKAESTSFNKLVNLTELKPGTSLRVFKAYKKENDDELDLDVGDVLDLDQTPATADEYWWFGTNRSWGPNNGNQGYFPSNCVKIETWEAPLSASIPSASKGLSAEIFFGGTMDQVAEEETDEGGQRGKEEEDGDAIVFTYVAPGTSTRVVEDYAPEKSDELGLKVGEIVIVLECPEGGWWRGMKGMSEKTPKSGWFPGNYVQILTKESTDRLNPTPPKSAHPSSSTSSGTSTPKSPHGEKKSWYKRLAKIGTGGSSGGSSSKKSRERAKSAPAKASKSKNSGTKTPPASANDLIAAEEDNLESVTDMATDLATVEEANNTPASSLPKSYRIAAEPVEVVTVDSPVAVSTNVQVAGSDRYRSISAPSAVQQEQQQQQPQQLNDVISESSQYITSSNEVSVRNSTDSTNIVQNVMLLKAEPPHSLRTVFENMSRDNVSNSATDSPLSASLDKLLDDKGLVNNQKLSPVPKSPVKADKDGEESTSSQYFDPDEEQHENNAASAPLKINAKGEELSILNNNSTSSPTAFTGSLAKDEKISSSPPASPSKQSSFGDQSQSSSLTGPTGSANSFPPLKGRFRSESNPNRGTFGSSSGKPLIIGQTIVDEEVSDNSSSVSRNNPNEVRSFSARTSIAGGGLKDVKSSEKPFVSPVKPLNTRLSLSAVVGTSPNISPGTSGNDVVLPSTPPAAFGKDQWLDRVSKEEFAKLTIKEQKRQTGIWELIVTERDYIRDLILIIDCFMKPLVEKKILNQKVIGQIFSNIDAVLLVNQELLRNFDDRASAAPLVEGIGDIMMKAAEKLMPYTMYCSNQATALTKVQSLMSQSKFRQFIEELMKSGITRGFKLGDFLLKPVQRLCKYPLLIEEIIKFSEDNTQEHANLKTALEKLKALTNIVNESARQQDGKQDGMRKIIDIQNSFNEKLNFANPNRFLVREDNFNLFVGHSKKSRRIFLFNDLIIIARKDWRDKYHLIEKAGFRQCRVSDVRENPSEPPQYLLEIEIGENLDSKDVNRYLFSCTHKVAKQVWLDAYRNVSQISVNSKEFSEISASNVDGGDSDDEEDDGKRPKTPTKKTGPATSAEKNVNVSDLEKKINELSKKLVVQTDKMRHYELESQIVKDARDEFREKYTVAQEESAKWKQRLDEFELRYKLENEKLKQDLEMAGTSAREDHLTDSKLGEAQEETAKLRIQIEEMEQRNLDNITTATIKSVKLEKEIELVNVESKRLIGLLEVSQTEISELKHFYGNNAREKEEVIKAQLDCINELESELTRLKSTEATTSATATLRETELEVLNADIKDKISSLKQAQETIDMLKIELQTSKSDSESKIEKLQSLNSALTTQMELAKDQHTRTESSSKDMEISMKRLQSELQLLNDEHSKALSDMEAWEKEIADYKQMFEDTKTQKAALIEEKDVSIIQLRQQVQDLVSQLEQAQQTITAKNSHENAGHITLVAALEAELEQLKLASSQSNEKLANLTGEYEIKISEIAAISVSLRQRDEKIEEQERQLIRLADERSLQSKTIEQQDQELIRLINERDLLSKMIEEQNRELIHLVDERESQIKTLNSEISTLNSDITRLSSALDAKSLQLDAMSVEKGVTVSRISEMRTCIQSLEVKISDKELELSTLKESTDVKIKQLIDSLGSEKQGAISRILAEKEAQVQRQLDSFNSDKEVLVAKMEAQYAQTVREKDELIQRQLDSFNSDKEVLVAKMEAQYAQTVREKDCAIENLERQHIQSVNELKVERDGAYAAKDTKIKELTTRLEEKSLKLESTADEYSRLQVEFEELKLRINQQQDRHDSTLASLNQRLASQEEEKSDSKQVIKDKEILVIRLENEKKLLQVECSELKESIESFQRDSKSLQDKIIKEKVNQIERLNTQIEELDQELDLKDQEVAELSRKSIRNSESISRLKDSQISRLEEEKQELEREVSATFELLEKARQDLFESKTSCVQLEQQVQVLTRRLDGQERNAESAFASRISSVQAHLAKAEQERDEAMDECHTLKLTFSTLEREFSDLSERNQAALKREIENSANEKAELNSMLQDTNEALQKSEEVFTDLKLELQSAKQRASQALGEITELQAQVESLKDVVAKGDSRIQSLEKETFKINEMNAIISTTETELQSLTASIREKDEKLARLEQQLARQEIDLENERQSYMVLTSKNQKLEMLQSHKEAEAAVTMLENTRLQEECTRLSEDLVSCRKETTDLRQTFEQLMHERNRSSSDTGKQVQDFMQKLLDLGERLQTKEQEYDRLASVSESEKRSWAEVEARLNSELGAAKIQLSHAEDRLRESLQTVSTREETIKSTDYTLREAQTTIARLESDNRYLLVQSAQLADATAALQIREASIVDKEKESKDYATQVKDLTEKIRLVEDTLSKTSLELESTKQKSINSHDKNKQTIATLYEKLANKDSELKQISERAQEREIRISKLESEITVLQRETERLRKDNEMRLAEALDAHRKTELKSSENVEKHRRNMASLQERLDEHQQELKVMSLRQSEREVLISRLETEKSHLEKDATRLTTALEELRVEHKQITTDYMQKLKEKDAKTTALQKSVDDLSSAKKTQSHQASLANQVERLQSQLEQQSLDHARLVKEMSSKMKNSSKIYLQTINELQAKLAATTIANTTSATQEDRSSSVAAAVGLSVSSSPASVPSSFSNSTPIGTTTIVQKLEQELTATRSTLVEKEQKLVATLDQLNKLGHQFVSIKQDYHTETQKQAQELSAFKVQFMGAVEDTFKSSLQGAQLLQEKITTLSSNLLVRDETISRLKSEGESASVIIRDLSNKIVELTSRLHDWDATSKEMTRVADEERLLRAEQMRKLHSIIHRMNVDAEEARQREQGVFQDLKSAQHRLQQLELERRGMADELAKAVNNNKKLVTSNNISGNYEKRRARSADPAKYAQSLQTLASAHASLDTSLRAIQRDALAYAKDTDAKIAEASNQVAKRDQELAEVVTLLVRMAKEIGVEELEGDGSDSSSSPPTSSSSFKIENLSRLISSRIPLLLTEVETLRVHTQHHVETLHQLDSLVKTQAVRHKTAISASRAESTALRQLLDVRQTQFDEERSAWRASQAAMGQRVVAENSREKQSLVASYHQIEARVKDLLDAQRVLEKQIAVLLAERESWVVMRTELEAKVDAMTVQNETLAKIKIELDSKLAATSALNLPLVQTNAELETRVTTLTAESDLLVKALRELKTRISNLSVQNETLVKSNVQLVTNLSRLEREKQDSEKEDKDGQLMQAFAREKCELLDRLASMSAQNDALIKSSLNLENRIKQLDKEQKEVLVEKVQLESRVQKLIKEREGDLQLSTRNQSEEQISILLAEKLQFVKQVEDLEAKIKAVTAERETLVASYHELEMLFEESKEEVKRRRQQTVTAVTAFVKVDNPVMTETAPTTAHAKNSIVASFSTSPLINPKSSPKLESDLASLQSLLEDTTQQLVESSAARNALEEQVKMLQINTSNSSSSTHIPTPNTTPLFFPKSSPKIESDVLTLQSLLEDTAQQLVESSAARNALAQRVQVLQGKLESVSAAADAVGSTSAAAASASASTGDGSMSGGIPTITTTSQARLQQYVSSGNGLMKALEVSSSGGSLISSSGVVSKFSSSTSSVTASKGKKAATATVNDEVTSRANLVRKGLDGCTQLMTSMMLQLDSETSATNASSCSSASSLISSPSSATAALRLFERTSSFSSPTTSPAQVSEYARLLGVLGQDLVAVKRSFAEFEEVLKSE